MYIYRKKVFLGSTDGGSWAHMGHGMAAGSLATKRNHVPGTYFVPSGTIWAVSINSLI